MKHKAGIYAAKHFGQCSNDCTTYSRFCLHVITYSHIARRENNLKLFYHKMFRYFSEGVNIRIIYAFIISLLATLTSRSRIFLEVANKCSNVFIRGSIKKINIAGLNYLNIYFPGILT